MRDVSYSLFRREGIRCLLVRDDERDRQFRRLQRSLSSCLSTNDRFPREEQTTPPPLIPYPSVSAFNKGQTIDIRCVPPIDHPLRNDVKALFEGIMRE